MEKLEKIQNDVKNALSSKRYLHSVGVMERAKELAKIYNEDGKKAQLIGIAHDIAKEMSKEEKLQYVKDNDIYIDDIEKNKVELLHGKIAADICKKKYGFTKDMTDAIEYHTTSNPKMDTMAKIIYLADKTEKYRNFDDLEYARDLANKNLDEAIIYCLDIVINENVQNGQMIHPNTIFTRNKILLENNK